MTYDPVPDRPDLSPLVPPPGRHAVQFLIAESGASARQINYWRSLGYLGDHLPRAPGSSGRGLPWRAIDLAVVTTLVSLSDAVEPRAHLYRDTADAARAAARRFEPFATVNAAGGVSITLPVRGDWWRYARRYDDKDAQPVGAPGERHAG